MPAPDTLDVITLTEAKRVLNPRTTAKDEQIEFAITAASRLLDNLCGPVVQRTITEELHQSPSGALFLRHTPVVSITTVKEWSSGTETELDAETAAIAGDYLYDSRLGTITRRSSWYDTSWSSSYVTVTYVVGRYASTAAVDRLFKWAAQEIVAANFKTQQGAGSQTYGDNYDPFNGLPPGLPRGVNEFIASERRAPAIA
jgi:hypothetical protein